MGLNSPRRNGRTGLEECGSCVEVERSRLITFDTANAIRFCFTLLFVDIFLKMLIKWWLKTRLALGSVLFRSS